MQTPEQLPEEHLLQDFENHLEQANGWKRFANYLIDLVVLYFILVILILLRFPFLTGSSMSVEESGEFTRASGTFVINIWAIGIDILYLALTEAFCKGKTIGKLVTGTRVVNEDGSRITFKTAILRSLSRLVPFEIFSALGSPSYPWHDRWTHTYVIDEKKSGIQ